jgi:hypothetical protein
MLVGVIRPDFRVARGAAFVESPVRWAEALSILQVIGVTAFAARGLLLRRRFDVALGAVLLAASAVALWSATHIEERIFDHDVYWMVALGILNLAVLAALAASPGRRREVDTRFAAAVAGVLSVVMCVAVARQLENRVRASYTPLPDAQRARAVAGDLAAYFDEHHISRPLVTIDQDAWEVAAGAILDLQKHGTIVSVEDDWVVMFTPVFRRTGREDAVVAVTAPAGHLRLRDRGLTLISAHEPVYAYLSGPESPIHPAR